MNTAKKVIIENVAAALDIPESAYEKAEARYEDLGEWFGRQGGPCANNDPHIRPQGSFRLGTVTKPVNADGEYDLDMGCRLMRGISTLTHSQKDLKELIGKDLESYRQYRGIQSPKEEKRRCWRLHYQDDMQFHLDLVPSIPEPNVGIQMLKESIFRFNEASTIAADLAKEAGAITDNTLSTYPYKGLNWPISNSEGFAKWFEFRMRIAKLLLEKRAMEVKATVDTMKVYEWKSPLQRCIQILKVHRDIMFANEPDGKPASVIITTLAARAYNGEEDIETALENILNKMGDLVRPLAPHVPNPVNPAEDFADKWYHEDDAKHNLKENFWRWLRTAQQYFRTLTTQTSVEKIASEARQNLGVTINTRALDENLKQLNRPGGLLKAAVAPLGLSFPNKAVEPNKPAGFAK